MNSVLFLRRCRSAVINNPRPKDDDWPDCDKDALIAALEMKVKEAEFEKSCLERDLQRLVARLASKPGWSPERVETVVRMAEEKVRVSK